MLFPTTRDDDNAVSSLSEPFSEINQQIAVILHLPCSEGLMRIIADYGGIPGLSLVGEADAAREWIEDPARNRKGQRVSLAFFRRWLQREYEASRSRQLARDPTGSSPIASTRAIRARLSQDPAEKTWRCPTCGDIPPLAFAGGWYARRPCPCEKAAQEAREIARVRAETVQARAALTYTWLGRSWFEPGLADKRFASFQRFWQPQAYDLAQAFARCPQGTLALYGSFGTGKTHLIAAIANAQVEWGKTCRFASAVSFFDAVQERLELKQDYHSLLSQAISAPLLLLDDVDKLKPSEFREETLYKLLNGRSVADLPPSCPRTTLLMRLCAGSAKPGARV